YARHVARSPDYRSPESPETPIKSVKVYRVLHTILQPGELADEHDPNEPTRLVPVYMGEFDTEGQLRDKDDPMLYWVVPIRPERKPNGSYGYTDYVKVHAGTETSPASEGH